MEKKRVGVIGAGPSGLSQLHAFQTASNTGTVIPEIVCFEKQAEWGGLWNYSWRTGTDENGEPCHGSMYRNLWSNGPKECLEYVDYSFEEHFGKPIGSYPPQPVLLNYIKGRAEKSGIRKWVRFNSPVRLVTYSETSRKFTLTVHDYSKDHVYSEDFDNLIVATGHFSVPDVPHFDGIESFHGRVLHSHDFRNAAEFKGKNILIVGRSYSAEDIASQCYKYGARSITISYRSGPIGHKWPENITEVPLLERIDGNTCHFTDGQSTTVDAIILCTGYSHHFPFLPNELRLKTTNRFWPLNLYRGVIWEGNTALMYIGMQDQFYTLSLSDVQAWYVRDVILERITLPPISYMKANSQSWRDREEQCQTDAEYIQFKGDYVRGLVEDTDYPDIDIEGINNLFLEWEKAKADNIMTFRDHSYRSVVTGNMAAAPHTTWLNAMDDSVEAFLQLKGN